MLHRGKAHTYGLDGPFGIAYGASIVWFVTTLAVALPTYAAGEAVALVWAIAGVGDCRSGRQLVAGTDRVRSSLDGVAVVGGGIRGVAAVDIGPVV